MNIKTFIVSSLIFALGIFITRGQDTLAVAYPVVGELLPDFVLDDVHYSTQNQISLNKIKGRPFILDFFSLGCPGCFKSFPKVNDLNKQFDGEVEFVLVGNDNMIEGKLLRKAYEAHRKRYSLNLSVAYDSKIFNQFKVSFVPTVIWIDKEGVVQAITNSEDLTKENIKAFINGKSFIKSSDLSYDRLRQQKGTSYLDLVLTLDIPKDRVIEKSEISILGECGSGSKFISLNFVQEYLDQNIPLKISGAPLANLYRAAYFGPLVNWLFKHKNLYGRYHYSPILEIVDSTLFQLDSTGKKRSFYYHQFIPIEQRTLKKVMRTMQKDLFEAFGYKVVVETREMPCLKLIASDEARKKLRTKGREKKLKDYFGGIDYQNVTMDEFIRIISDLGGLVVKDLPLMDETGITGKIDIKLENVAMLDWKDVKRALQEQGLDMVMGEKEMKVLVIRDPEPTSLENDGQ